MVKIALISDIHFGEFSRTEEFAVPGANIKDETQGCYSLTEGLIEHLKQHEVEYIFVAGDLTSIASPQEFYYCEKKLIDIAEKVNVPVQNVVCCLGNHDVDRKIANLGVIEETEKYTQDVLEKIQQKYCLIAASSAQCSMEKIRTKSDMKSIPFVYIYEKEEFVVFVLNTGWLCFKNQKVPHGKLSKEQLEWFENQAITFQSDPRKKILMMHHHPVHYPYPTMGHDISIVEESSEILDIAGRYGIDLIIHGHRHHPRATTIMQEGWLRPIAFVCAGSLAVNAPHRNNGNIPNTFHVIEIGKEIDKIVLHNYQYTDSMGWMPFDKWKPETPMDSLMNLGKMFDEAEVVNSIKKYVGYTGGIEWDSLDECLKFKSYAELNKKFREILTPRHLVGGNFPEKVVIIDEGGAVNE